MKRENILISEDYTTKRVSATKFTAPGDIPALDCSIHFSKEGNDVTLQNCFIKANALVKCSPDDTYDFETGALIALMKMCGVEKVVRACNEAFSEDTFKTYTIKYERELNTLKKDFDKVKDLKDFYKKNYNERLEEIKNLKKEKEQFLKDMGKLQHEYDLCKKSENALQKDNEAFRKTCRELKEENERLKNTRDLLISKNNELIEKKKDLKKKLNAMYGYIDTDNVKPELPRTLDINGTVYRKSIQIKDFGEQISKLTVDSLIEQSRAFTRKCVDEWLYEPPTKREKMWENIFALHKESDVIIKVKKEDVNTFLHEIENKIPEITWVSSVKIFETKYTIDDIYAGLKLRDVVYFRLSKETKLSYSGDPDIYQYRELKHIDYLPPMRWDLFKKGRLVVKVDTDNYKDFYNKCEEEIGRKPRDIYIGTFTVYYKNGIFFTRPYKDTIPFAKKIVDWEDVR